jgi:dTDP-4-amino-4,6-dideoxygalactose transaminase
MKVVPAESHACSFPNLSFILPPSSFPLVPLAVPYWNGATYRAILRSLLTGSVIAGSDLGKLRASVIETLGVDDALLCSSGSFALEIALRACGVQPGDEVVIPTFCCTTVVAPILSVGAIPIPADVGDELNATTATIEAALTNKTTAIIVPHLFGNPADIEAIIDLARSKNIRVIDDAAQALGATINGTPVGSFGDAGVLSFGGEKICAGLGGGVLVSRNRELLGGALKVAMSPASRSFSLRNLLSTMMWRCWRRWTLPLAHRTGEASPDAMPAPFRRESMANLNATAAFTLMQTLSENLAARRARVDAYRDLLGNEAGLKLIPHRPGSACLTQVVRVWPRRRREDIAVKIIGALGAAGYEVQGSYLPIHLLPAFRQWHRHGLARAEKVWEYLIELPCEPDVSFVHVERIAEVLKRVLSR